MTNLRRCPFCGRRVNLLYRNEINTWNEVLGRTYYIKHRNGWTSKPCHMRFEMYIAKEEFKGNVTPQTVEDQLIREWNGGNEVDEEDDE